MDKNIKKNNQLQKRLLEFIHHFFFVLVAAASLAVLVSGYIFLLKPKFAATENRINEERSKKEEQKYKLENYLQQLTTYRNSYNTIGAADKRRIDLMIAGKYLPEEVFDEMSSLIASRGLILNSIQAESQVLDDSKSAGADTSSPAAKLKGVGEVKITLNLSGINYNSLKQLLAIFENSLRLVDVKNVQFTPEGNSATLELATYYLAS